jgi:Zn-dependent M28 family amino/carboxypeptidase
VVPTLDLIPRSVRTTLASEGMRLHPPDPPPVFGDSAPRVVPPVIAVTPNVASVFRYDPHGVAFLNFTSTVHQLSAPTRNVIAMIEGSDPARRGEVVVLSAHSDHLGIAPASAREGSDSIMNGADVGGSGAVALLEIAEYLAAQRAKPGRTVVFLWTVGEEQGMLGAQWFTSRVIALRDMKFGTVVADINVDAIGRGGAADINGGGPGYVQVTAGTRLSTEFEQWLSLQFSKADYQLAPDFRVGSADNSSLASCTGDHWSFSRAGVPSIFVTTGTHADSRAVTDAPGTIDYDKLARVTQFVSALTMAVANREQRPRLADSVGSSRARCGL